MEHTGMDILERPGDRVTGPRSQSRWGLILAGGEGRRLRPLTRLIAGDERPKQFHRVLGRETLLEAILQRAAMLISADRILATVVRGHERFYAPLLASVAPECLVIQPEDRGSAPAILYGLLRLLTLAPSGSVAIFPSDHYVSDERVFMGHVERAFEVVLARPDLLVLLGVAPDSDGAADEWIEPADPIRGPWPWPLFRVRKFWEKPSLATAQMLGSQGCLWNSFVMVAHVSVLFALLRSAVPALHDAFASVESRLGTPREDESFRRLYARLPSTDFSRRVLATRPANLAVLPVSGVEWSDLGEPRGVMTRLARMGAHPEWVQRRKEMSV
jgi:mannose-1-phosphate guanylyltransferase